LKDIANALDYYKGNDGAIAVTSCAQWFHEVREGHLHVTCLLSTTTQPDQLSTLDWWRFKDPQLSSFLHSTPPPLLQWSSLLWLRGEVLPPISTKSAQCVPGRNNFQGQGRKEITFGVVATLAVRPKVSVLNVEKFFFLSRRGKYCGEACCGFLERERGKEGKRKRTFG